MRNIVVWWLSFGWICSVVAQTPFEQGNAAYQEEAYQLAIANYEKALATQEESAALYFNLGNAHYKLGHIAPSIFYYEKALLLEPNADDVRTNLVFAQKLQIDEVKQEKRVGIEKILYDFSQWMHVDTWANWAIVFAFLGFGLFALYYLTSSSLYKRLGFTGMTVSFALLLVCLFTAYWVKATQASENPAIVFERKVEIKSEPKSSSSTVFQLHEGTKVWVLEQVADYHKVELADGKSGWIPTQAVRFIK